MAGVGVQTLFAVVAPLVLLPVALRSPALAAVSALALVLLTAAVMVGLAAIGRTFLVLGFLTVPLTAVRPLDALPGLQLSDMFLSTGFVLLAPHFARTALRLPVPFILGAFGILTTGTLSALATEQPGANFSHLLDLVQGILLLPILLVWSDPSRRSVIAYAGAYVAGNGINVVASLIQGQEAGGRYIGLTTHANVMGLAQALSVALIPFLFETVPARFRWLVGAGALISAYGIWISGSRAALLAALTILAVYPLLKRSILAALSVAALSIPASILVSRAEQNLAGTNALSRLLGAGGASGSNEARVAGAREGIDQFLNHPLLGDGWLTVWGAHNSYLQVAASIGIFGLVSYLLLLVPILHPLLTTPPPYRHLALPGLAFVAISLVDPSIASRHIWSVVSLALIANRLATRSEATAPRPPARAGAPRIGPHTMTARGAARA